MLNQLSHPGALPFLAFEIGDGLDFFFLNLGYVCLQVWKEGKTEVIISVFVLTS